MRITRASQAPPYEPPLHSGVAAVRLQGHEAGPTEGFWVGLSTYAPGGEASESATAGETVYVLLEGALEVSSGGVTEALGPGVSVHLPQGTVRSVRNGSGRPARLLVVIGTPR
jgi:quercetin dioxygenase-like cupin family protein